MFGGVLRGWEDFLATHGHSPGIVWTFRDDFVWDWRSRTIHVDVDDADENRRLTEALFDCRDARSLGTWFKLVGSTRRTSYCSLFVPDSEREAEELMINGTKYTVPLRPTYAFVASPAKGGVQLEPMAAIDLLHRRAEVRERLAKET